MSHTADLDRGGSNKGFTQGTHRVVAPSDTIARVLPIMPLAGITRIGVITGLDHIGLPVVAVYRPNARSLAVSQGKGLDLDAARASGIMEAIESWHAEHVTLPLMYTSWAELQATHPVVDVRRLPRLAVSTFHPRKPLLWTAGQNIVSGDETWVPFEMVHTNFSLPLPAGSGSFMMSSNGLASGNHFMEATIHGICEVVERDANALWFAGDADTRARRRIDPATIDDADCLTVLDLFAAADIAVAIWDTTSDIGLASFRCLVVDRHPNVFRQLYAVDGSGCHPAREIALLRALTEAAQCRLTYISGARDDGGREFFERVRNPDAVARARREVEGQRGTRRFSDVPTLVTTSCADDVHWACERLSAAGIGEVVVVDLTKADVGIPVVRVIVPGLEGLHDAPGYVDGERVRAIRACVPS
jgi:ribosomal protein S12 methylthiotransferase accessory factor